MGNEEAGYQFLDKLDTREPHFNGQISALSLELSEVSLLFQPS